MNQSSTIEFSLEHVLGEQRERLVRLCAYLSGDISAADDLAQETLIEAWRNQHKLIDPHGYQAWLSAIARNVSLRWMRRSGRESAHNVDADIDVVPFDQDDAYAKAYDLEFEIERADLATLLDRAMALLPIDTRAALIEKYIAESSLDEIADRLGLSANAVAVRLHRGKLALRRVLTIDLHEDAIALGLIAENTSEWQPTRIWCPDCGQQRLIGRLNGAAGELFLRCPVCYAQTGEDTNETNGLSNVLDGVKSFKPAYTRMIHWAHAYYRPGLIAGSAPCTTCGRPVRPHIDLTGKTPRIDASCWICHLKNTQSLNGHALGTPAGQAFWRAHSRIRTLPERHIDLNGHPAIMTTFESITDSARLEVAFELDTFAVHYFHNGKILTPP